MLFCMDFQKNCYLQRNEYKIGVTFVITWCNTIFSVERMVNKVPLNSYFDVRRQNGDINISTAYNAQSMVKSCHVLYIKIIRKLQISLPHHCFLQHPLKRMSRHPRNSQNMGWKNLQKLQNPPMFNAIFDKFSQMLGNISNNPLKHPF